jgi:hypothetical protein
MESTTKSGNKTVTVLLVILAILSLAVCCYFCVTHIGGASASGIKATFYDGPATLPLKSAAIASSDIYNLPLAKDDETKITVGGKELFVYATGVNAGHTWSVDYTAPEMYTPVAYFDADFGSKGGELTVKIDVSKVKDLEAINSVEVLPSAYGIKPKVSGKTVTFNIKENGNYTVVFNDDEVNAVHLFANEPENYAVDEDTVVIGPGEWIIDNLTLESDTTYYIQGGAVVHTTVGGNFIESVKVYGHGIIDGSMFNGWKGVEAHVPFNMVSARSVVLDGPMFLNSNCWVINATDCNSCVIQNVKVISGRANGDGITLQSCQDMTIRDAFVRSWDDSCVVKNYTQTQNSKNIKFSNIQIWTDLAQSMEIGYETNKNRKADAEISDISFKDVTVLFNWHKPVISIHNSDDAWVHDISYENIVVEHANMGEGDSTENRQLIDFNNRSSGWSTTNDRGKISDVTITNVKVNNTNKEAAMGVISRIVGNDPEANIENITIKDLYILGTKVTNDNYQDAAFKFETNEYISNLKFE